MNNNSVKNKIITLGIILIGIIGVWALYWAGIHEFTDPRPDEYSKNITEANEAPNNHNEEPQNDIDSDQTDSDIPASDTDVSSKTETSNDQTNANDATSDTMNPSEKHTGWFVTGGSRYYYDKNGVPLSGPNTVDEKTYIFSGEGRLITEDELLSKIRAVPESGEPILTSDYRGAQHKVNEAANYNKPDTSASKTSDNTTASNNKNSANDKADSAKASGKSTDKQYIHDTLVGIGGYTPTETDIKYIQNRMNELKEYNVGFVMLNLYTGKGVAYNIDNSEYSASCIKGPYVASLVENQPDSLKYRAKTMQSILELSDNDAYNSLRGSYGRAPLVNLCEDLKLDSQVSYHYYPFISARELAALWIHMYIYLNTTEQGKEISDWYSHPNNSSIYTTLGVYNSEQDTTYNMAGSKCTGMGYLTQSKAGWISSPNYRSTTEGGIIYPDDGDPYLIAICTDIPADLIRLEPLCTTLNKIYENTSDY